MSNIAFYEHEDTPQEAPSPWATPEEMARFAPSTSEHGLILADGVSLTCDDDVPWEYRRNSNVMVVGGTGSGKTRSFIEPNLVNRPAANLVITDTKQELHRETAEAFAEEGYEVLRLDASDPAKSCRFDPLRYVEDERDIPPIAAMILDSIDPNRGNVGQCANDSFWMQTATQLLRALIALLLVLEVAFGVLSSRSAPGTPYVFLRMDRLLALMDLICIPDKFADKKRPSPLDRLFAMLAEGTDGSLLGASGVVLPPMPTCYAVRQYRDFKTAAIDTQKSIVISLNAMLSQLKTPELMRVFSGDDLRLDQIDEGRRVVYLVMSDNESSTSFLGRMAFRLLVNRALKKADESPTGVLGRRVMLVCDEFANLGKLADFERVISIARSRGMSFQMCVQSISQLRHVYGSECATIVLDNCDSVVYMGAGSSCESAEYISRLCGTVPMGTRLVGVERNRLGIEAEVMSPSEISRLPRTKCIVKISGARPYLADKFDITRMPNAAERLASMRAEVGAE